MKPSQRLRRLRAIGLRSAIAIRTIRYLRHKGHRANEEGDSDRAVALWTKMMRLQARANCGQDQVRYLRSADWTNGIGHNALLDFFVKRRMLGLHDSTYNLVVDPKFVANRFYLDLWQKHFCFTPFAPTNIELFEDWPMLVELNGHYVELHQALTRVNAMWGERAPVIEFPRSLLGNCYRHIGTGWFVTMHLRHHEPQYDSVRNIRDPRSYQKAVDLINAVGGRVVVIGKKGTGLGLNGVIDARGAPDWLDIFLISQCRFFIGSNSGPSVVAGTFGKRLLVTNYAPSGLPFPYPAITLPKTITRDGKLLSQFEPEYLRLWTTTQLAARGLELHDNTEDEIAEAVERMLHETDSTGLRRSGPDLRLVSVAEGTS